MEELKKQISEIDSIISKFSTEMQSLAGTVAENSSSKLEGFIESLKKQKEKLEVALKKEEKMAPVNALLKEINELSASQDSLKSKVREADQQYRNSNTKEKLAKFQELSEINSKYMEIQKSLKMKKMELGLKKDLAKEEEE